jgi:hypothetical protein
MDRLYLNCELISSIEGRISGVNQGGTSISFKVQLDHETPEGTKTPTRTTEDAVPLRNGDCVVVYEGFTADQRLGYCFGLQILDDDGNELFRYKNRNSAYLEGWELEWHEEGWKDPDADKIVDMKDFKKK